MWLKDERGTYHSVIRRFYPVLHPILNKEGIRYVSATDLARCYSSGRLHRCPVPRNQSLLPFAGPLFTDRHYFSSPRGLAPVSGTGCCWRAKVGTIYTLAENPGEISRSECLGRPCGISGRLARVQCTLPPKQWALLNIRRG